MGSWDETCALTSAAIRAGDPCIMVVTKLPTRPLTWESHFGLFYDKHSFKRVTNIVEGKYNDYGGLEEFPRSYDFDGEASYFFTKEGWEWALEECKKIDDRYMQNISRNLFDPFEEESDKRYHALMEKLNADRIANGEPPIDSYIPRHKYPDRINEFYLVSALCTLVRRPLYLPLSGPQWGYEYRDTQLRYLDHVKGFVKRQYMQDKVDSEEWESEDDSGVE
jgi:hypothetical protein